MTLPEPIGLVGDVMAGLTRLLERLCEKLAAVNLGARRLRVELRRVDGDLAQLDVGLARPMRDPAAIARLFARTIEKVDAGFGFDQLRMTVSIVEEMRPQQLTSAGEGEAEGRLADLITRIGNRLGFDAVRRHLPADSHIPERSYLAAPAAFSQPEPFPRCGPRRPLILFAPEPLTAQGPTPPARFSWRRMRFTLGRASGPERLSPEWWLDDPEWRRGLRDYWFVQTLEAAASGCSTRPRTRDGTSMANLPEALSPGYAELCVTSNFTFLTGASHPEELVLRAAELGLQAIAITDRNSLAGVVRAHVALRELRRRLADKTTSAAAGSAPARPAETPLHPMTGRPHAAVRSHRRIDPSSRQDMGKQDGNIQQPGGQRHREQAEQPPQPPVLPKLIIGARLTLVDCPLEFVALPVDKPAYARLSRLLTLGKRRAIKGSCTLYLADLMEWGNGLILIALPPDPLTAGPETMQNVKTVLNRLVQHFPGHVYTRPRPATMGRTRSVLMRSTVCR
ncbi:PHP domain-containing protein [Pannonibacter sp. Pt2-lr]